MKGTLDEDPRIFTTESRWILLRERSNSDRSCRKNKNTRFVFKKEVLRKSCLLRDNVKNYGTARQATDDNTAQAHCMLDT
jgi:hypothetical protein